MRERPNAFAFPEMLEMEYSLHSLSKPLAEPRRMFRGNRTVADLRKLATQPFEPFVDGRNPHGFLDVGGGCGESCEVFADEEGGQ